MLGRVMVLGYPFADHPMERRMKIVLVLAALCLAGCATKVGIAAAPDGTLTATRRGADLASATGPLRQQALKDAGDYCAAKGLRTNVISSREIPAIGHWPEAEVVFKCE